MPSGELLFASPTYLRILLTFILLGTTTIVITNLIRTGRSHLMRAVFAAVVALVAVFPVVASNQTPLPARHPVLLTFIASYTFTLAVVWLFVARPARSLRVPPSPPTPGNRFLW